MGEAKLLLDREENIVVSGSINYQSIAKLRDQGNRLIVKHNPIVFDFKEVSRSDSTGLLLLIAWTRFARNNNKTIHFVHLPASLLEVAKVSQLNEVLPIEER